MIFSVRKGSFFLLLLACTVLLVGCQQPSTPAPTPTEIPAQPTSTPLPTAVPSPTPIPATPYATRQPIIANASACDYPHIEWTTSDTLLDRNPSTDWQTATPEEMGMDPAILQAGIDSLADTSGLYSLLVVRHDHIVVEEYFNGAAADHSYEIASASKSIISALVGIALDKGYLTDLNQTLGELLPDAFPPDSDYRSQNITLRQMLTMTAHLIWEPETPLDQIRRLHSVDMLVAIPLTAPPPAVEFQYSTGLVQLMSAVLTEASGMSTCQIAEQYLFGPLNIRPEYWEQDADGIYTGGWYMYLTPRELARFGQLYLHDGRWQDEQIISEEWVRDSLSPHVGAGSETYYGYWWWLSTLMDPMTGRQYDVFSARGGGEQMIIVIPELDLIMVTTSDHAYQGAPNGMDSFDFVWRYVIPAIEEE